VASRPLRVEELAEVLAVNFEEAEGRTPKFNEDWQLQDRQRALMITCSSLIAIVDDHGSRVVQFSHFSVKEFLTSDRLATSGRDISSFHILPEPAHAILTQACLAVLLRLHDNFPGRRIRSSSPLAGYAAQHWVGHAQFKKVSFCVEEGMRRLFDQSKPYFAAWLKLHDIDSCSSWYLPTTKPHAAPLYYASLCGFRDLAEHLVVKSPQCVNARGGRHHSPLAAALRNRHFHVAELLHQHGAVFELASYNNWTLLVGGLVDAVRWLIERGANVNLRQSDGRTSSREAVGMLWIQGRIANASINLGNSPLHVASAHDHFGTVRLLIQHGADVSTRNNSNLTPLHLALSERKADSMRLLIQHGADVNARDWFNWTPLHLASFEGRANSMQLLIQHGADVNARDGVNSTPLHLASSKGKADSAHLLIQHGADVNPRDGINWTPLHRASSDGDADTMQLLIHHGADVNPRDKDNSTPLHLVFMVSAKSVQLFIQHWADITGQYHDDFMWDAIVQAVEVLLLHGADVNARNKRNSTPLHLASSEGDTDSVKLLILYGADVNARDKDNSTPLHVVFMVSAKSVQLFIRHWADITGQYHDDFMWDPIVQAVEVLLLHGADVNARNKRNSTPLHLASFKGYADSMQLLIRHGADVNARDEDNSMPLHLASTKGKVDSMQLLIQYGADVNARGEGNSTPLHLVFTVSAESVQLSI